MIVLLIGICGAMWGSFLNSVAWYLIADTASLLTYRSQCPQCSSRIAWYDLIPIISWFILHGKCRNCNENISTIYPFIEGYTAALAMLAYSALSPHTWVWYGLYSSLLIITVHTDFRAYAISPLVTSIWIPVGIASAYYTILPISWQTSLLSACISYSFFAGINAIFRYIKGHETLGQGDWELIAYVASYTGIEGVFNAILYANVVIILWFIYVSPRSYNTIHTVRIPYGACLAIASTLYPILPVFAIWNIPPIFR